MQLEDKTLECVDLKHEGEDRSFVWSADEQQYFVDQDLKFPPRRCKKCRRIRREQRKAEEANTN